MSRAYSTASSGLIVCRLIVTFFCHVDLATKFGLEFDDGKTLVDGPQRPAHVLAALRFDLQAFSIGSDTGYLGKQGRAVGHILLLDESRAFAMTSCMCFLWRPRASSETVIAAGHRP